MRPSISLKNGRKRHCQTPQRTQRLNIPAAVLCVWPKSARHQWHQRPSHAVCNECKWPFCGVLFRLYTLSLSSNEHLHILRVSAVYSIGENPEGTMSFSLIIVMSETTFNGYWRQARELEKIPGLYLTRGHASRHSDVPIDSWHAEEAILPHVRFGRRVVVRFNDLRKITSLRARKAPLTGE